MDSGGLINLEARSVPISVISSLRKKPIKDALQFILFFDFGGGVNNHTSPGERRADYLLGMGPGFRYTVDPAVAARLDWGIKLHNAARFQGGSSMLHFSVTASY